MSHKALYALAVVWLLQNMVQGWSNQQWSWQRKAAASLLAGVTLGSPGPAGADTIEAPGSIPSAPAGSSSSVAPSISSIREGISTGASMVPGFGPKDVQYPQGFEGRWRVVQSISKIEDARKDPQKSTIRWVEALVKRGPGPITYEREYLKKPDGSVVLERAGAATNFYKELLLGEKVKAISQWDASNPNLLTTTEIFAGSPDAETESMIQESKVTKRSQESASTTREISQTLDADVQMGYSEFSRISEEDLERDVVKASSVPRVIGSRLLARYKYDTEAPVQATQASGVKVDRIKGVERLYIYPGDVLDLGGDKPDIVVKSTVSMERLP